MNLDENQLYPKPMIDENKDIKSFRLCKVCGNIGAQMYYGAECCPPCKVFFRRNCEFDLNNHQCVFNGQCDITVNSRTACRYCRLKKCFSVNLQKELIRGSRSHQNRPRKKNQQKSLTNTCHEETHSLPITIPTLNLLRNDPSLLTVQQWSLLSNVINSYDDKPTTSTVQSTMTLQSTYPSKIRLKMAKDDFEYVCRLFYDSVGPFMKKLPEFRFLPLDDRISLTERNIRAVSTISGTLILRETDVYNNPYYYYGSVAAYGTRVIEQAMKIASQADINGLLLKLCLPILAFSTCSDALNPAFPMNNINIPECEGIRLFSNAIDLFKIQNIYVELLFKYMLYQFGYKDTILRFLGLVKTALDLSNLVVSCDELRNYDDMINTVVKQTKETLILHYEDTE